jgi:hypothetical protein
MANDSSSKKPERSSKILRGRILAICVAVAVVAVAVYVIISLVSSSSRTDSRVPTTAAGGLPPPPTSPLLPNTTTVLVVGSSVARGRGAEPEQLGWANLLGSRLHDLHGYHVVNQAVGGYVVANVRTDIAAQVRLAGPTLRCDWH